MADVLLCGRLEDGRRGVVDLRMVDLRMVDRPEDGRRIVVW